MTIWAVVPVKDLTAAKQRLAAELSPAERRGLARAMLVDVLETLRHVPGLSGLLVVTRDAECAHLAEAAGARCLTEPENLGQSEAVSRAAKLLATDGATALLQVPGDVPNANPAEFASVLGAHAAAPAVTIVPADDGRGSNCVLCSPPDVMPFQFGNDSFVPHCEGARRAGVTPRVLRLPGIGLDIDTPDDVRAFLGRARAGSTRDFLRESGIAARLRDDVEMPAMAARR